MGERVLLLATRHPLPPRLPCRRPRPRVAGRDAYAPRPGPGHNEGFGGGGGGGDKKVVIRCRHKCCEVSSPTHAAPPPPPPPSSFMLMQDFISGAEKEAGGERGREEGAIVDVLSVSVSFEGNHCEITIAHDFHLNIPGGRTGRGGWAGERGSGVIV